jgi:restriction endonuclease Mrr
VDGVLRKNGATSIVQCKRYLQPVGEPEVRDFLGTVTKRRALEGFFITTSTFNTAARSFAEGTPIRLIDGDTLAALINHLKCVDPLTGQPVDLPTFNSDHWSEFSFIRRETREPARRQ